MNEGETRTVDKPILGTGLENDIDMTTSFNRNQSISNGNISDIKTTGIDGCLNVDDVKTVEYTNGGVFNTAIKNGPVSRNKMKDAEVSALDKDGLITDTEREPDNQDEKMRNAPIDRGWAWVILFGKTFKFLGIRC